MKKVVSFVVSMLLIAALPLASFAAETAPSASPTGTIPAMSADSAGPEMDKAAVILLVNAKTSKVFGSDMQIDTDNEKVVPFIDSGRTLIPAAFIAKAYGATVMWDGNKKVVTIKTATKTAIITINSQTMLVNGNTVTLDVPAKIVGARTFLPLRAIVESIFDKKVAYSKGLIYISDT